MEMEYGDGDEWSNGLVSLEDLGEDSGYASHFEDTHFEEP